MSVRKTEHGTPDLRTGSEWCSNGLKEPPLGFAKHYTTPKYLWRRYIVPNTFIRAHVNTLGLHLKYSPLPLMLYGEPTHFQPSLF